MSIVSRIEEMMKSIQEAFDLEKGERRIVDTTKKWKSAVKNSEPAHDHNISSDHLSFHTGKIAYSPAGGHESAHDYATHSEHVIVHNNKPIGYATVHHAHPRDLGRAKEGGRGESHDHHIDIHAPGVHPSAHALLRAKLKEHIKSKEFTHHVDEHNKKHYDYEKPKPPRGVFGGNTKVKNKYD